MAKNLMGEAHRHCARAIRQVEEFEVWGLEAGNAFGQLAVLYMAQNRPAEGAKACRTAIAFWREVPSDGAERMQASSGIAKCLRLMTDAGGERREASGA